MLLSPARPFPDFGDDAPAFAAGDEDDDVDGAGDEALRRRGARLHAKVFKPHQRIGRGIGVQRQEPAGMAGVPGLEHFKRCAIAHFADDDAIGAKPQCHLHQIAHG
jgi:hypothetical protein